MRAFINQKLMPVNLSLMAKHVGESHNQRMVERKETFSDRFEQLRAGMSYERLSEAIEQKTGHRISAQGLFKYTTGQSRPRPKSLAALSTFWDVSESWLLFGGDGIDAGAITLEDAVKSLPSSEGAQVLDFLEYKFQRSNGVMAKQVIEGYGTLIERLRTEIQGDDDEPPSERTSGQRS